MGVFATMSFAAKALNDRGERRPSPFCKAFGAVTSLGAQTRLKNP